jgi:hypothetical protein
MENSAQEHLSCLRQDLFLADMLCVLVLYVSSLIAIVSFTKLPKSRNINCLSTDYAYNAFRSALLSIYNYNRNQYATFRADLQAHR